MPNPNNTPTHPQTLYIIYNATSTLLGKLTYAARKLTCPDPTTSPPCAACELTHGPSLSLKESPEWLRTRARIQGVEVRQVHGDEMPEGLRVWMRERGVGAPSCVVSVEGGWREVLSREDLARVRRDHGAFLGLLEERAGCVGLRIGEE